MVKVLSARQGSTDSNHEPLFTAYLKMKSDNEEMIYDLSGLIQLIQLEGPADLSKLLRDLHHDYAVSTIEEMTKHLNNKRFTFFDYSEEIPIQLMILKKLADCIDSIKPVVKH